MTQVAVCLAVAGTAVVGGSQAAADPVTIGASIEVDGDSPLLGDPGDWPWLKPKPR